MGEVGIATPLQYYSIQLVFIKKEAKNERTGRKTLKSLLLKR
jgi:hypothetical protein